MLARVLVDAVPDDAGSPAPALLVDEGVAGRDSQPAPQVVLVAVGLLALPEDQEELADRPATTE
eukprot:14059346-Alexandrium_andersonii.AAC.1